MLCPCNSGNAYEICCKKLHDGENHAVTAEQLMRSRFAAFYLGSQNINPETMAHYIENTCHNDVRQSQNQQALLESFGQTHWCGLVVIDHNPQGNQSTVEFVALFENTGNIEQLHELSQFEKIDNHWAYKSGKILEPYSFKRNQRCWCNSGKKYKHCHGQ